MEAQPGAYILFRLSLDYVCKGAVIILVGNKLDLRVENPEEYVDMDEAQAMMDKLGAKAQFQCSARDEALRVSKKKNVERVFKAAIKFGLLSLSDNPKKTVGGKSGGCILF